VPDRWHMKHLLKERLWEKEEGGGDRESEIGLPADSLGSNRLTGCVVYDCAKHAHTQTQWGKVTGEAAWDHSVVESRAARFLHRNLLDSLSGVVGWRTQSGDVCMTVSVTFKICKSLICDVKAFTEICLVCLCLPGWCQCSVCLGPEGYRCTGIRVSSLLAFNF